VERWLSTERNDRVYALLGAITIAFSSILVRLSHASPSTATVFRCAYAVPLLAALAWLEDRRYGRRPWRNRRIALVTGVFFAVDLMLWTESIKYVGAGLSTVLANSQVVFVPVIAWLVLSEKPGWRVLAALPIALLGVILISGVLEHGAYGRDPTEGALLGLGAGAAYAGFLLLLRHGGSDVRRPAGPLCDVTVVTTFVAIAIGLVIGDARLVPAWPSAGWLLLLAISSQVVGWLLITVSLPRLQAAQTSLMLMIQPVGSVLLAALILSEAPSALQLGGVAVVLAAVLVATLPKQVLGLRTDKRPRAGSVVGRHVALSAADEHDGL
jgi:drug/metabolite transporter (DMT)-like permease